MTISGMISAQPASLVARARCVHVTRLGSGIFADLRENAADDQVAEREKDARHHAGHEHLDDGLACDLRIHHHRNRWRDDRAEQGTRGDHGAGESLAVALPLHGWDQRLPGRHRVGDRGAGHAGHDEVRDDRDVTETATHTADHGLRPRDQAQGQATAIHQLSGEDEQRNLHQRVAVDAIDHRQRQHRGVDHALGLELHAEEGGQHHREADVEADQQQQQERCEKKSEHVRPIPCCVARHRGRAAGCALR